MSSDLIVEKLAKLETPELCETPFFPVNFMARRQKPEPYQLLSPKSWPRTTRPNTCTEQTSTGSQEDDCLQAQLKTKKTIHTKGADQKVYRYCYKLKKPMKIIRLEKPQQSNIRSDLLSKSKLQCRGGSRIFSRGGGADFQKIFQNFDDLFFFF